MASQSNKNIAKISAILLFIGLSAWWAILTVSNPEDDSRRLLFGATYGLMALFGGIFGLLIAKQWGGLKSSLGRTVLYLAAGLLLAEFGQIVFSYYNIIKEVEIPYPSLADVGFFGNIPFYILAALTLSKVTGVGLMIKKNPWKLILSIFIPLGVLLLSYSQFLKGYDATEVPLLTKFLDFGYPLGQAIYISLALIILFSAGRRLGGILKKPVLFLLAAFALQYAADFNFLYQTVHETWINGGYGDFLYLLAYFAMTMSLISLNSAFKSLKTGVNTQEEVPISETTDE